MMGTDKNSPQRWTAKRKAAIVLEIIKGKTTPAEVALPSCDSFAFEFEF